VLDPLGYLANFTSMFFFMVLVHEASHAIADPRNTRGVFVGLDKRYGIVVGVDVEKLTVKSLIAPQVAVPLFLTTLWLLGYIHWVEALALAIINTAASGHDLSLLLRREKHNTKILRVGVYLEPPHLRIGWI